MNGLTVSGLRQIKVIMARYFCLSELTSELKSD